MNQKLIILLAVLLFVGCQEDMPELIDDNLPNADGSIGFRLTVDDASFQLSRPQTRGIPHNELDSFSTTHVDIYSHTTDYHTSENDVEMYKRIVLEQKEKKWDYEPHIFWPDSKRLSFVAYASDVPFTDAGITFSPTTGAPDSLTYTVPDSVTKQPDLLVSTIFNQPKTDNIALTMKHALACISFCGDTPDKGLYVRKIVLRNVYGKGKLKLDDAEGIKWVTDESSKGIPVYEAGIEKGEELEQSPIDPNYLMTEAGYLMMIPQKLKDAAIDVHYWNGKDNKNDKIVAYTLPIDDESYSSWKAGQKYVYKFGTESDGDITVIYYEKYENAPLGVYYNTSNSTLSDDKKIVEAGYGVVSTKKINNVAGIKISDPTSSLVTSGTVIELSDGKFLYPVSQSGAETFKLPKSCAPQNVYFNNSSKPCGMIIPHFAKGVYTTVQTSMKNHIIRTPQQMRNITSSDASAKPNTYTYKQELDLDFSIESIGGGTLATAVVNREFNDLFEGNNKRIENVTIEASMSPNGGLFQTNGGVINQVELVNSSIYSNGNAGGIAAINNGKIIKPRVIGDNESNPFKVEGTSECVGAIAGQNSGTITGNTDIETATEIPVAEVSGWVTITGRDAGTGGITGENTGIITTCLVNGVHVTGQNLGDAKPARITIKGGNYVGGIVGVNRNMVKGNYSGSGATLKAEPDVAGLVSITGTGNWVGGIAGENRGGTLNQVNVRLGRGTDATEGIIITGVQSVGGIVGYNNGGTLKADGKSFISVRGNVIINGKTHVGGIVGNNGSGEISNCFVYNFYSQKGTLTHYAPKITGATNVGGIVGYAGTGIIKQCAVFSTVSVKNTSGDDVRNAVVEINATEPPLPDAKTSSAGGIVGHGFTGLTITESFVLGNVKINGNVNSGGIVGENEKGTTITSVHIGNSGQEVSDIYNKLFDIVKLPVRDSRMKGMISENSGTPTITGDQYIGGICGVNWGEVKKVEIKDNVNIGTSSSTFVGGIAGGNGVDANILDCKTYNPKEGTAAVMIKGFEQVGGIIGLNNGIVKQCQLGLEQKQNQDQSRSITIQGASSLGGIAGSNGGHTQYPYDDEKGTGNDNTIIENCNVYGKVVIEAVFGEVSAGYRYRVGGILGQNGPTNRVIDCNVVGYTSNDITVKGVGNIGGIAGINYGLIHGFSSSSNNKVTHTTVSASNGYAGGLVGAIKSKKTNSFVAELYYCDVSNGVYVNAWGTHAGAFAGQIEGVGAIETNHTLFGTASNGPTNKVCTGNNPVKVNGGNVKLPPSIGNFPYPVEPAAVTNLWADYQMWNYLCYTTY